MKSVSKNVRSSWNANTALGDNSLKFTVLSTARERQDVAIRCASSLIKFVLWPTVRESNSLKRSQNAYCMESGVSVLVQRKQIY